MKAYFARSFGLLFQGTLVYLAFVATYWVLHWPAIGVLGILFHFSPDPVVPMVNRIVYFPLWMVCHGPDMILMHWGWYARDTAQNGMSFWVKLGTPIYFVLICIWCVQLPLFVFRCILGLLRRPLGGG